MSAAQDKTGVGSGRSDWRTPWGRETDLFDRLNAIFAFNYDAAASHDNALCDRYSTLTGTFVRTFPHDAASHAWVSDADGIGYSWRGLRVFHNPPYQDGENPCHGDGAGGWKCDKKRCDKRGYHLTEYQAGIADFAQKAYEERNSANVIVGVYPAATDTAWWHDCIEGKATYYPLRGRVQFINPETLEPGGAPPGGTAIVVWLPDWLKGGAR